MAAVPLAEPSVANPATDPCRDDARANNSLGVPGIAVISMLTAQTDVDPDGSIGAEAEASIASAAVTIGTLRIETGLLESHASAACTAATAAPSVVGSSSVTRLRINGGPAKTVSGPQTIHLGLVTIHLNRSIVTSEAVTQRAVEIIGPLTRVVLAEAVAGVDACAQLDRPPTAVLEIFTPPIDLSDDPPEASCSPSTDADDPHLGCSYHAERTVWTQWGPPGRILWAICKGLQNEHCAAYPFDEIPWTFDFRGSTSSDPDGDLTHWAIDFGDGTSASGSWHTDSPVDLEHTYVTRDFYTDTGYLTLTLTVTDAAGHVETDTLTFGLVAVNDV